MVRIPVVIADPCQDNRESLALLLTVCGIAVDQAESLAALGERLRSGPAAGVVTEVFGNPDRTTQAIRDAASRVPTAFYTTHATEAARDRSAGLGCRHFVKPLDVTPLLAWLDALRAGSPPPPGRRACRCACAVSAGRRVRRPG